MKSFFQRLHSTNPTHIWLLSGLVLAISPHISHLPITLTLFSAILLGWRLGFELQYIRLPGRLLRMVLTLVALIITFIAFHTLFGRQAGIGLLVVMLCLKLMEMKEERDVIVAIGLGYFVVVTVFLFNQSIFIGFYMLIVVVLLTTALVSHNREHSTIHQSQNLKLAGTLLLQATPLLLLLFVLFPRIPGPLWNLPSDSIGAKTGLSDSMSPGKISNLSENNAVAFRVKFDDKIPPQQDLYWRGPVLNHYDGKTWTQSGGINYEPLNEQYNKEVSYRAFGTPVNYTVTIEPNNQKWLFTLEMIADIPAGSKVSPEYEVLTDHPIEQLKRYSIQSYTYYRLDHQNRPTSAKYLQVPDVLTPRIRELLVQWQKTSNNNPGNIVDLALQYFTEKPFYYTRRPPLLLNNPVDEFLFETRRGFCEHYASAFVFLMRASGIPARVVTGYQGGESNPISDYFIVRQSDAHAWAEVWLADKGWLRIDPTSVIPPDRIEHPQDLHRIVPDTNITPPDWATRMIRKVSFGLDNINHFWNQWILNYNNQRQQNLLNRLSSWFGFDDIDWRGMVFLMAVSMSLVFGFFAIRLLTKEFQRKDPVVSAYQKFCRKLARFGITRDPAEGAMDFANRINKLHPNLKPAISHITTLYQHLRYTKHPPPDGIRHLQIAVRKFRPQTKH